MAQIEKRIQKLEAQRTEGWAGPSALFHGETPDGAIVAKSLAELSDKKLRDILLAQPHSSLQITAGSGMIRQLNG
ncbi:MAG: hypothetical protein JKY94_11035 [Rhodobacteraceae bacterium]|nr:hypothetical protein [Paracoccaceae bacterium]